MNDKFTTQYIECDCGSSEHTIRLSYIEPDDLDDYPEIWIETQLTRQPFWRRIWVAIKYTLGYQCKYGHWDCTSLSFEEMKKIKTFIEEYETKWKNKN